MYIYTHEGIQAHEGLGQLGRSDIDDAIGAAKRQMKIHLDLQKSAGKINDITAVAKEATEYLKWFHESLFLEGLKAVYESQSGVPLSYRSYPVAQSDPITNKVSKDLPWRQSKRQTFRTDEAQGSFCLGAARAMAFRTIFGLDKPTNRQVLMELKKGIEAAKKSGGVDVEAKLIISRIVSHKHDPGSLKQFNEDLASRYGIKNTIVRSITPSSKSRNEALAALRQEAPVIADRKGAWHWVLVQRSPRGELWANDPLPDPFLGRIYKIPLSEWGSRSEIIGSRFEIIVDASTGALITPDKASAYKK